MHAISIFGILELFVAFAEGAEIGATILVPRSIPAKIVAITKCTENGYTAIVLATGATDPFPIPRGAVWARKAGKVCFRLTNQKESGEARQQDPCLRVGHS